MYDYFYILTQWWGDREIEAEIQREPDIYRVKMGPSHLSHGSPKPPKPYREQYFIEKFLKLYQIFLKKNM